LRIFLAAMRRYSKQAFSILASNFIEAKKKLILYVNGSEKLLKDLKIISAYTESID
jgi:hypothetical protein